ncbi:AI-2E family transporter [Ligilactobacillus agilis]|uniref:AI-2E family transporter n=1 Tax=Ligilactobacillus agilis TaxID=1601 RepID=UPI001F598528|nr:AI-2E family transporter [Ligilactobacillus agilis]UNL41835.1 AI-2E family transporter [Ligilactobacillus agilis]UNL58928.1 AI-2E family transporter [Ligilactobacillus agilis]
MENLNLWQKFIANERFRRFVVLAGLIGILYLVRSLMSIILLTFIFTFLVVRAVSWVQKYLKLPSRLIVIVIYALLIALIYLGITIYVPKLIEQSELMVKSVLKFYQNMPADTNKVWAYISSYINSSEIMKQVKNGAGILLKYITSIGSMGFTFLMSLLLSFFFTVEKDEMYTFSKSFLKGPNSWLFKDIYHFAKIFVNTFGVVMEAQFMIALVNTAITLVCLSMMKMPQIISLGLMIFVLSLVPVAGVIISAIPLSFIAYSVGGIRDVIYVIVMLLVVHALESYILNPKLMSSKTELPIFYTFVVLVASEHLFGVWGLIVGIPIFTFALDVLGVKPVSIKHQGYQAKVKKLGRKK